MDTEGYGFRPSRGLVALGLAMATWLAGCATPGHEPSLGPERSVVSTHTAADPVPEPSSLTVPVLPVSVAILYSGSVPTHRAIADRIGDGLSGSGFAVSRLDIDRLESTSPIDAAFEESAEIVAAVGPGALNVARQRYAGAEIVFSQVLEAGNDFTATRRERGVAPILPPAVQFEAWAELDTDLKRIGLITGANFAIAVPNAEKAAAAVGAKLVHRISTSDRETLYIFRRLATEIDGLWLAPDSEILSSAVIDEILAHAAELDIGVLVFSESLLKRGGLINVGAPLEHIAGTVIDTIEQIRAGQSCSLPAEIPLSEATVRVNAGIAADLGLPVNSQPEWILHDQQ